MHRERSGAGRSQRGLARADGIQPPATGFDSTSNPALPGTIHVVEPIVDKLGSSNTGYALYLEITATCAACPPSPPVPPNTQQTVDMRLVFAIGNGVSTFFYASNPVYPGGVGVFGVNPPSPITPPWPGWMHITVEVNRTAGNAGTFYLNGVAWGGFTPVVPGVDSGSNTPFLIGGTRLVPATIPLHGEIVINELEIFDAPLSPADVQSIATAPGGKCTPVPTPTATPARTTATPTFSPSPAPSTTPTRTPTATPTPTSITIRTPTPTGTRTPSPSPTASPRPTPTATATATRTPTCIAPPSNMVAWWTGDNTTNDLSGNGNTGTLHGAAGYTSGMVGAAFSLPTIADFVEVPDSPTLNFSGNFSMDAWINTTNPTTGRATIVDKRVGSNTNPVGYHLFLFAGLLGFQLADGQPFLNQVSPGPLINDGSWHHVAATINRASTTGGNLYVDGALIFTFDPTTRPGSITNSASVRLGVRLVGSPQTFENFQGAIDEVELFDRELAPQEVHAIFAAGSVGKCKTPLPTRTATPTGTRTPTRTPTATAGCPGAVCTPTPTSGDGDQIPG